MGLRRLPDGTVTMTNQPIASIILMAAGAVDVQESAGLPDWARTERHDITAKPLTGVTPEQRAVMMRTMFVERMKLVADVEERERTTLRWCWLDAMAGSDHAWNVPRSIAAYP